MGLLELMFPDILGSLDRWVACAVRSFVEVNERGVLPNTRRVKKAWNSIHGGLATNDHLISIQYHPGGRIMADQVFSAKSKGISKL